MIHCLYCLFSSLWKMMLWIKCFSSLSRSNRRPEALAKILASIASVVITLVFATPWEVLTHGSKGVLSSLHNGLGSTSRPDMLWYPPPCRLGRKVCAVCVPRLKTLQMLDLDIPCLAQEVLFLGQANKSLVIILAYYTLQLQIPSKEVLNLLKAPRTTFFEGMWSLRDSILLCETPCPAPLLTPGWGPQRLWPAIKDTGVTHYSRIWSQRICPRRTLEIFVSFQECRPGKWRRCTWLTGLVVYVAG